MAKIALVVKREILFKDRYFEGFLPIEKNDYVRAILKNFSYAERTDEMEHDRRLKQIIPYIIIINSGAKKIFAYRRAPDQRYYEARLRNHWSIGIGGHIEKTDAKSPIESGMMRELKEEVKMKIYPEPKIIGYINDDEGPEEFHFAVVYILDTTFSVEKGDDEMVDCRFYSAREFEKLITTQGNELEKWSRIAWPVIKKYFD